MNLITSPQNYHGNIDVFLAGGISDCPDWQNETLKKFDNTALTIANPRRSQKFDKNGPLASEQIEWEFEMLNKTSTIFFWFPKEALCPIALFELGKFIGQGNKNLIIGTDKEYVRRFDIIKQLELARVYNENLPDHVFNNLDDMIEETMKIHESVLWIWNDVLKN